jgi:hypothetical protein
VQGVEAGGGRGRSYTLGVATGDVPAAEGGPATGTPLSADTTLSGDGAGTAGGAVPPAAGRSHRRLRPLWLTARRAGWALLVVGLLGAGVTGGWALRGWLAEPEMRVEAPVIDRPVVLAEAPDVADGAPNVLGHCRGKPRTPMSSGTARS